jgi:MurNAc alpha-1-phosphate uridylyltransferase
MTKAMLLAAGRGERLRPLTDKTPKPLIPVHGKPLIAYTLEKLPAIGITEVVINISYLAKQFPKTLGDGSQFGLAITYSYEPEVLETGGGILQALPLLGNEPFLVISGDIYTEYPFEKLVLPDHKLAHLVLAPNPNFHPEGDYSLTTNNLLSFAPPKYTYASFGILHPKLFEDAKPGNFSFIPLINKRLPNGLITGELYTGIWHNIGTIQELDNLKKSLQKF